MSVDLISLTQLKTELANHHAKLVAVSKTKPVTDILKVYETGHKLFGENYVQELTDKYKVLPKDIEWNFIGHLQSNKVKIIAPFISLIHGVDSLNLLKEIDKHALKNNRVINCLMQVHIAEEESKFGFSFDECLQVFNSGELKNFKNVNVCGLMGMATFTDDTFQLKKEFHTLQNLYTQLNTKQYGLTILSMGMTSDYKIALECGSNMVRIGSAIFGERNKQ